MFREKKITIIIFVFGAVVIFLAGIWLGMLIQALLQSNDPKIQQAARMQPAVSALSSKVVQTATAFGSVENVKGNKITLSYGGDSLAIAIKADAQIYSSVAQKDPVTGNLVSGVPRVVTVGDIKKDDQVSITFNISQGGGISGSQVYIFASR